MHGGHAWDTGQASSHLTVYISMDQMGMHNVRTKRLDFLDKLGNQERVEVHASADDDRVQSGRFKHLSETAKVSSSQYAHPRVNSPSFHAGK
jgi:hypothetical protein